MADMMISGAILTMGCEFKPGDQAPQGYLDWHEWAEVQHGAGLRQVVCGRCGLWRYPQELSGQVSRSEGRDRKGRLHVIETVVCNKCAATANDGEASHA